MTNFKNNTINKEIETDIPHDDSIDGYIDSIKNQLDQLPLEMNEIADQYLRDVFCIVSEIVKEAVENKDIKNLGILADVAMHDIREMLLDKIAFSVQGDPLMEELFRSEGELYDPLSKEEICDTEFKREQRRWYYSQEYSNKDYRERIQRQNTDKIQGFISGLQLS